MTSRRILIAMLTAALAVTACTSTPKASPVETAPQSAANPSSTADRPTATPQADPGGTPASPLPQPALIDDTDPDQVATAAVIALYTIDADTDTKPGDAYLRAAPWLTTALAGDLADTPPTSSGAWLDLAAHRGYTAVTDVTITSEYGQPPDSDDAAYRAVTFAVETVYRDGTAAPAAAVTARFMQLDDMGGAWKVSRFLP